MALDDLLNALEHEARDEVAARLTAAKAEADAVAAEAEARVTERRAQFVATREAGLRAAAELELVAARRDGRRLVLDARAEMLQAVRQAASAKLPQVEADPRYRALLPLQLTEALRYVGGQDCVVRSSSWLQPILAAAGGRAGLRVRTEEAQVDGGGFVLEAADGSVRVDMTLDGILDRLWPEFAMEIVGRVLAEGPPGRTAGLVGEAAPAAPGDGGDTASRAGGGSA